MEACLFKSLPELWKKNERLDDFVGVLLCCFVFFYKERSIRLNHVTEVE